MGEDILTTFIISVATTELGARAPTMLPAVIMPTGFIVAQDLWGAAFTRDLLSVARAVSEEWAAGSMLVAGFMPVVVDFTVVAVFTAADVDVLEKARVILSSGPSQHRRRMACSILAKVVCLPSTSSVSNSGGAFLRPQTATRMG